MSNRTCCYVFAAALLICASIAHGQISPFQGLGNAQFFDNNGKPLTAGVLYSFQAGTSTQQATFTDATGTVLNPNPIPFGSGARVGIWLNSGAFYKFVLCLQNDGAFCAPGDVLFSVDQVPGSGGGSSTGSPFIGTFISGSASPASTGILRLATGDSICWRNTANSANLCISKDSNDLLTWAGGSVKLPEVTQPTGVANFDILWGDNGAHRLKMLNNAGTAAQVVASGQDINTSDFVTQLHFGSTATPISSTPPTTNQFLQWSGTNIAGGTALVPLLIANDTITGTTTNTLTKVSGAPSAAIITSGTDTSGILGICVAGCANTGTATIQPIGLSSCVFDGATTANDYFNVSKTVAGNCHDIGTNPGGLGRVLSTNGSGGTYSVALNIGQGGTQGVTRDFSVSGCTPTTSTDAQCTGTITVSPALQDASYFPQLTINNNGSSSNANLFAAVNGTITSSSIPYSMTCTFNCSNIPAPTIYVHIFHP